MIVHVASRSIAPFGGFGGLERAAADHVARLKGLGQEVCVHTPTGGESGKELRDVPWPGLLVKPRSIFGGLAYAIWVVRLRRSIKSCVQPGDVVHFHGSSAAALAGVRRRANWPSVMNPHGLEEFDGLSPSTILVRPILRMMSRLGARRASRIVVTDESLRSKVRARLRASESKLVTIPNTVDVERLDAQVAGVTDSASLIRFHIVSVGRIEINKGYDLLARSLERLQHLDWDWTHFGDGSQRAELERLALDAGYDHRFGLRTGVSDELVQAAIRGCDLFVQPSRSEGSSLTTLEAMAHARTVVATRVGGIPDKIVDGESGFLCEPTLDGICDAVRRAMILSRTDRGAFDALGTSARATVLQRFSASTTDAAYTSLYDRLSGGLCK